MTSLLDGARRLVTRSADIGARIEGLDAATTAARGRLDDALVDDAASVVERATARLKLSADHTVVALAGATGSGKSSTFNALIGLDLAAVGVRRPTTSWATACVWGTEGADDLLEWLGIPRAPPRRTGLHARPRPRGPAARGRGPARPPRPRLHRGLPPPRGRPAGAARRPDGVGPRPPEVRRRRDPRPLPRSAGEPPRRHGRGAQPHRHGAGVGPRGDAVRRPPTARPGRSHRRAALRRQRPAPDRHHRAQGRDRPPRRGQEADPDPDGGRRQGRGRTARRGHRPRHRTGPAEAADRRAGGRVRGGGRRPDGGGGGPGVDPAPRQPGDRLARHLVAVAAQARPAQAAPPRPRVRRQAAHRPRPHVRARADPGAARPGRHRGASPGRRRDRRARPAVGIRRTPGLGLPSRRPPRPAGPRPRRAPTSGWAGSRCGPGWCGCSSGR